MNDLNDLLLLAAQYGLPGLLIVIGVWLVAKVIDRGIEIRNEIRIPPKRPSR